MKDELRSAGRPRSGRANEERPSSERSAARARGAAARSLTGRGASTSGVSGSESSALGKASLSASASPGRSGSNASRPASGSVSSAAKAKRAAADLAAAALASEDIVLSSEVPPSALLAAGNEREAERGRGVPKTVVLQSMGQWGKQLAMRPQGRVVQQELDATLRGLPPESVLVIDFDGVEMMDYSFADEALGAIFSRMSAKEYPNRYIVLAAGEGELAEALLENVEVALARREVAALVLPKESVEENAEGSSSKQRRVILKSDGGEWRVAGTLPTHLVDTLRAVMDKQQVTVRELADELNIDSATACNNRIARLYQLRLVRREAAIVPEGGRQYFYSSVI
jgi:hypothetical protein